MKTLDAIHLFLQSRQAKGLSKQTIRWYRGILSHFAHSYPSLPKRPQSIEAYLAQCPGGDERKHGYYRTLRCFYRFLHKRIKTANPIEQLEAPHRNNKNPHWCTPDELNRLLVYPHPPKIKAAILFLIDSGARLGELSGLSVDNLKETPWGFITEINGKTGVRYAPLSYETYHALMVNLPLGYSTNRLGRLISLAFKNAGVKGTAHSLRHTFGTLWEGEELVLQQIMGHTHLSTTKIYRHLRTKIMSEQHRKHSPLRMVMARSKEMGMV